MLMSSCLAVGPDSNLLTSVITGGTTSTGSTEPTSTNLASDPLEPVSGEPDPQSSSGSGSAAASPVASIPLPTLQSSLAYATDANNDTPVTGTVENAGFVAISDSAIGSTAMCEAPDQSKGVANEFPLGFIRQAFADTTPTICDTPTVTCCAVNSDNSFECFYEASTASVNKLYMAAVSADGVVSANAEETIQGNLLYLGHTPVDLGEFENAVVSLTSDATESGNNLATTTYDATTEKFVVTARHAATVSGQDIAYSATDGLVGVMNTTTGVNLQNSDLTSVDVPPVTVTEATAYTQLKALGGRMYVGYEQPSNTQAYLRLAVPDDWIESDVEKYMVVIDNDGTMPITHTRTIAFDQVEVGPTNFWTVVVFEDDAGNVRVRMVQNKGDGDPVLGRRLDGEIWKPSTDVEIKDVVAYYDDDTDNICYALLDSKNTRVWTARFNISTNQRTISETESVTVGADPVAMAYNTDDGNLYVLNKEGKSLSVVSVVEGATAVLPTVSRTIDLSNFIEGKDLHFSPNAMVLSQGKLLVGDETTRAVMVVDPAGTE